MSLIQVNHLTFCYEGSYDYIFQDVSFSLETTHKTALIGRNARGKTTFLNLLMGLYEYQGTIIKSVECTYFPYYVENKKEWTIHICENIEPDIQYWQLEKELNALKVDLDVLYRPFDTLSKGEQTKVLLAVLFLKHNSFLLIDEPTNHLDQQSREVVGEYLRKQKGFLLVSHDRAFINSCCEYIIAINLTSIDEVKGNFSSWYEDKMKQDEAHRQKNIKLKKDISRLEQSRRQAASWSDHVEASKIGQRVSGLKPDRGHIGHMAAKMMKRSKNIEKRRNKAIEEKQGLLKDIEEYDDLKIYPEMYFQKTLLSFSHVCVSYDEKVLFHDFNLTLKNHDRVLLKGPNGCGKSSLIRIIMNEDVLYQGDYYRGSQLKISYVPQDCSTLFGSLDDIIKQYHVDPTLVKTILRKLGFLRIHFEKQLQYYSEGQKKKVMLAISLATPAHLYIWDEPLNYIDIFSRMQIEKLILEYQPTLLFVEHDTFFQDVIATKIIDFEQLI